MDVVGNIQYVSPYRRICGSAYRPSKTGFARATAATPTETAAAIIAATHVFPLFIFFLLTFGRYAVNLCMFARSMPVAAALDFSGP
jgi:hypothetical protein